MSQNSLSSASSCNVPQKKQEKKEFLQAHGGRPSRTDLGTPCGGSRFGVEANGAIIDDIADGRTKEVDANLVGRGSSCGRLRSAVRRAVGRWHWRRWEAEAETTSSLFLSFINRIS
ncbi:hypothetical protein DFH09DRAFT_1098028 [Mycena vulgaris]|nr:hypothetical protein DFH09DRAFT_1098028 [Mycena vulgaris]